MRRSIAVIVIVTATACVAACGLTPESLGQSDERLVPLWAAINRVDRESLGFTPIQPSDAVALEGRELWGDDYDAMLHIAGQSSRTIAFRKTSAGYEWIGEQETRQGPQLYTTPDGQFHEELVITYELQSISGVPLRQVHVAYSGDDARLKGRAMLTLADVTPILQEWATAKPQ